MSPILQVALFLASLAVIILAAFLIYFSLEARARLKELSRSSVQMKADLEVLVQNSHELISNATQVSKRISEQVDEVETVVRTVRQWVERADRVVDEVGSAIEPPIFTAVRNLNFLRTGANAFLQSLLHFNHHKQPNERDQQSRQEEDHV